MKEIILPPTEYQHPWVPGVTVCNPPTGEAEGETERVGKEEKGEGGNAVGQRVRRMGNIFFQNFDRNILIITLLLKNLNHYQINLKLNSIYLIAWTLIDSFHIESLLKTRGYYMNYL